MPLDPNDPRTLDLLKSDFDALRAEVGKIIIGQEETVTFVLASLLARGHVLLVGVPGLAKTLLVKTLAEALDLGFNRIQFTPDLMPSDITGTDVLEEDHTTGRRAFRFVKGPVFANVILADEINRTPPKTQAALLEAMQEQRVTVSGNTYALESPFFVLATQNPIEQEGTYPLPEAQLDRFMFNLWLDYPSEADEVSIVRSTTTGERAQVKNILTAERILAFQALVRNLPVSESVVRFAVRLARATRPGSPDAPDFVKDYLSYGAGPRASQYLVLGAKALAALEGRATPLEADIRRAAVSVLRHRIVTNFNAEADGMRPVDVVRKLLSSL
jgi:MoxR-like ATPase